MNPVLALIIANVIWGIAAPVFKYALGDIPPFTFLFIRFFGAAFIFLPALRHVKWGKITFWDWTKIIAGSLCGFSINIGLLFIGLQKAPSINATVITSGGPLFLFLMSLVFLKEKFKPKVFGGMMVSTLGIAIITLSPFFLGQASGKNLGAVEGNILYVVATIANMASIVFLKGVSRKIQPMAMTLFSFVIAAISFIPFMIVELHSWSPLQLHLPGIVGILYGLFISSALGYYLFFYGIGKVSGQEIGLFTYADPVAAVLVAAPLLGEYPNAYFILGSLLVFGGIFISEGRLHYHPVHLLGRRLGQRPIVLWTKKSDVRRQKKRK